MIKKILCYWASGIFIEQLLWAKFEWNAISKFALVYRVRATVPVYVWPGCILVILISGTLHTRGPERNSGHVTVLVLLDSLTVLGPEILDGKLETRYVYASEDIYFKLKMIYLTLYEVWVSIHQADERLTARSREASKVRDSCLNFSNPSEIWQAPRQQCCRDACPISEWYNHYNTQSRGFETSWDLTVRRLTA